MENTPQEKAKDIFVKHLEYIPSNLIRNNNDASALALIHAKITVDELIKESSDKSITVRFRKCTLTDKEYWIEVGTELEKIKTD